MFEKMIKRCPFCGSTAELVETGLVSVVKCTNCGAEGRRCTENQYKNERAASAVVFWNMREPESSARSGPLFCRVNETLGVLTQVSNILQGAPDSVVVEQVRERTKDITPEARYCIEELINRFHGKILILKETCKAYAVSPNPFDSPEVS